MLEKLKGEQASVLLLHTDYEVEQQLLLGADCCQCPCQWCSNSSECVTSAALKCAGCHGCRNLACAALVMVGLCGGMRVVGQSCEQAPTLECCECIQHKSLLSTAESHTICS